MVGAEKKECKRRKQMEKGSYRVNEKMRKKTERQTKSIIYGETKEEKRKMRKKKSISNVRKRKSV